MRSEELERSLRTDFENFLNDTLAEIKQEIARLEEKVFLELERQKSELEELFRKAKQSIPEQKQLDEAFRESIIEHLRLARDEGAQIATMAHAEAEELERQRRASEPGFAELSQSIKEISSKTTQSDILKSLILSAEKFSARGALFVVKNERIIGWHAFGEDKEKKEETIKSVVSPVTSNNILSEAINSLTTIEIENGNYAGDLNPLKRVGYGSARKLAAIPLVVRGRGVAVLYAEDSLERNLFTEALESLVRVTSMTVEILASMKSIAKRIQEEQPTASQVSYQPPSLYQTQHQVKTVETAEPRNFKTDTTTYEFEKRQEPTYVSQITYTTTKETEEKGKPGSYKDFSYETKIEMSQIETATPTQEVTKVQEVSDYEPEVKVEQVYKVQEIRIEENVNVEAEVSRFESPDLSKARLEVSKIEQESFAKESRIPTSSELKPPVIAEEKPYQPYQTVEPPRPKISTLADRHIDLPVEVTSEEERRYHNEARRFARLLVSEIKLYNQQKVEEGRRAGDLYDRLREAIDRSREMYDKRVKPSVASKFDYFHYELVQSLAEGDASKLGPNYPGPKT